MEIHSLENLTRVLQASISPVALVSGVGLLILSLTNRFGRVTERLRELARQQREPVTPPRRLMVQLQIFLRRAKLLRLAITCAAACVLLASLVVLLVFTIAVLELPLAEAALLLFALSLVALIASLVIFLWDTHLSLKAVKAELQE